MAGSEPLLKRFTLARDRALHGAVAVQNAISLMQTGQSNSTTGPVNRLSGVMGRSGCSDSWDFIP